MWSPLWSKKQCTVRTTQRQLLYMAHFITSNLHVVYIKMQRIEYSDFASERRLYLLCFFAPESWFTCVLYLIMQHTVMTLSAVCQAGSLPISFPACRSNNTLSSQVCGSPLSDDVYTRLAKGSWAAAEAVITKSKSPLYFTQSLCWRERVQTSILSTDSA